jgi:DNA-binding CsgD family transcriptional regulator
MLAGLGQGPPRRRDDRLKAPDPSTWSEHARAGASGDQASACFAWLCIGLALGASERRDDALERLDLPSEMMTWAEAYGRHLLGAGRAEYDAARSGLLEAARTCEVPKAQVGPATTKATPGFRLSATETAVARLVADGRSNKQIAAELLVSHKTVEYHLSNIYRRLGFTSRVKLAQLVQIAA